MATRTLDLTDQVTGLATAFATLEEFLPGTLEVYLNGVRQRRAVFFVESGPQSFTTSEPPRAGDALAVQFEVPGAGDSPVFPLVVPSGIAPGSS